MKRVAFIARNSYSPLGFSVEEAKVLMSLLGFIFISVCLH